MPYVEPFRGVYYDTTTAGAIEGLIAPPYDKVSPELKRDLLTRSANNAVRLELPEDDNNPDWYAAVAEHLGQWLFDGVLHRDDEPMYYVYEQEFDLAGTRHKRWGFVGALRLSHDAESGIRPHEQTFDTIKAERLQLLRATRTNASPIFLMYDDPQQQVRQALDACAEPALFEVRDDDGTLHRIRRSNGLSALACVQRTLREAPMVIADGHHRYETALNYSREMRQASPNDPPGMNYNFVMAYFTPAIDSELVILPAHRLFTLPPGRSMDDLARLVEANWDARPMDSAEELGALIERGESEHGVGLVTREHCALLLPKQQPLIAATPNAGQAKRALPVTALHALLIDPLLGDQPLKEYTTFHRVAAQAIEGVQQGRGDAALLWRASRPSDVMAVAAQGDRMPQKSTDFYPKVATGLVFNVH